MHLSYNDFATFKFRLQNLLGLFLSDNNSMQSLKARSPQINLQDGMFPQVKSPIGLERHTLNLLVPSNVFLRRPISRCHPIRIVTLVGGKHVGHDADRFPVRFNVSY